MPVSVDGRTGIIAVLFALIALVFSSAARGVGLPDGRAYEAVSAVASEGAAQVFVPAAGSPYLTTNAEHGILTRRPLEVATDGQKVIYHGDSPPTGGTGNAHALVGSGVLGARSSQGGWVQIDIQPPNEHSPEYVAFATDLSVGVLQSSTALAAGAPDGYENLYIRRLPDGPYIPAFTGTPQNRPATENPLTGEGGSTEFNTALLFAGMNDANGESSTERHLLFEANDVVTGGEGAVERELSQQVKTNMAEEEAGKFRRILYDSVGGVPSVVNVLPDGKADADASFGSFPTTSSGAPDFSHVISDDGSRIYWTDNDTHNLYVRENSGKPNASTVQVDVAEAGCIACVGGAGRFLTASTDGTRAFFTDENRLTSDSTAEAGQPDLYERDVETARTTDLTVDPTPEEHANVQGLVGASNDGSYIYFVANGVLAANKSHAGEQAEAGKKNLYLLHNGATEFIAGLTSADGEEVVPFDLLGEGFETGDWSAAAGYRTAEVTPDGHSLVFMSNRGLTGYDNQQTVFNRFEGRVVTVPLEEVFLYGAGSRELRCVSCAPEGTAPVSTEFNEYGPSFGTPIGGFIPVTKVSEARSQPRVLSDDGSRVFFDSGEPLVPQNTNGWLSVYEWEQNGTGSCRQEQGCVYLLSSGVDPESSYLIGASATGSDAFFVTRARLAPDDRNENDDLYDAHECTGASPCSVEVTASGCAAGDCVAPLLQSSTFASPASLTFVGPSGTSPPTTPPTKCKPGFALRNRKCVKKPARCKRGFVKKKSRCVRRRSVMRGTSRSRGKQRHAK